MTGMQAPKSDSSVYRAKCSTIGYGQPERLLNESEITAIITSGLEKLPLDGRKVLVIIPDHTRTMPLPMFFRLLTQQLSGRVAALDFLVALGTHPPLSEEQLQKLLGITPEQRASRYQHVRLLNHAWDDPHALVTLGVISKAEMQNLSQGMLAVDVPVRLNRLILEYDHLLVCGPVFPHEVVGFSGGNKYFFPGIAGREIIDFTHWLGALITSYSMIGTQETPVRSVIDRAAAFIDRPRHALCSVVTTQGVHGLFIGAPEEAFAAAASLSAQVHIRWVDRPYPQVLSVLPEMYDEIWTGAKGMYKLEPVVADGGELIIYAPHIHTFSVVHGEIIRQVGYHVRDYFVKQWERFAHYPWGVLAHSTHLRGVGSFEDGVERPRIQVSLATSIPEAECRAVNLGYRDPASIRPEDFADREAQGILFVPHAGEILYRLRDGSRAKGDR
ncbi:MAG: lactate racemase domain-containing protein [Chloroflexota bacterium]